jgi:ADP-ribose pyrophosphatase
MPRHGRRELGPRITSIEVDHDEEVGGGGFLRIRRLRIRTRRADGSTSRPATCDFLERPLGLDAVAVAVYARRADGIDVLLREGLRPALWFGRRVALPVADPRPGFLLEEVVAGILEEQDVGLAGIRRRVADEVHEEAGFTVDPDAVELLGAPVFLSPGALPDKLWLAAVEVDPAAQAAVALGDGSPFEEGGATAWLDLDEAIAACVAGDLEDAKTELALRRLRERSARGRR